MTPKAMSKSAMGSDGLPEPFPSPPARPPKWALKIKVRDREQIQTFSAAYAAKKFLDAACGEVKMIGKKEAVGSTSRVTGDGLSEVVLHQYSEDEKKWVLPEPYATDAYWLREGEIRGPVVTLEELLEGARSTLSVTEARARLRVAKLGGRGRPFAWAKSSLGPVRRVLGLDDGR